MANRKIYQAIRIEKTSGRRCPDFSVKVEERQFGLFSSRKNAEKAITACVRDFEAAGEYSSGLAGFYVEEYSVDKMLSMPDMWLPVKDAVWSYTADGKPFSYSLFSSDWNIESYAGTPPDAIMFKTGDYAWAHFRGRFMPVRVLAAPYTPEEWRKKFGSRRSDASDDCYLAIGADGHLHPPTETLFPVDAEIPGKIIALIEDREKKFLNGESL